MIKKTTIKWSIIGIVSFLTCFENTFLSNSISGYSSFINYFGIVFLLFLILNLIVLIIHKKKINRVTIYTILFTLLIFISTVWHGGNIIAAIAILSKMAIVILTLEYASAHKEGILTLLKSWDTLLFIVIIIDLLTEIMFPNGMYESRIYSLNWFLGYKTERAVYSFPLGLISLYINYSYKQKVTNRWFFVMLLIMLNAWLSQATGVFVAYLFLFLLVYIVTAFNRKGFGIIKKMIKTVLNYKIVFIVFVFVTISIVFVESTGIMTRIALLLGKTVTFSSRTFIWEACIRKVLNSPIIGYGYMGSSEYIAITRMSSGTNAHNIVLALLMSGGIILLLFYIMMYCSVLKTDYSDHTLLICISVFIYASLLLGISSAAFVFSPYAMLFYWLFEYEKEKIRLRKTYV